MWTKLCYTLHKGFSLKIPRTKRVEQISEDGQRARFSDDLTDKKENLGFLIWLDQRELMKENQLKTLFCFYLSSKTNTH